MKFIRLSKRIMALILSLGLYASTASSMDQQPKQTFTQRHSKSIQKILKANDVILSSLMYIYAPTLAIPYLDKIPYVGNGINGIVDTLTRAELFRPISDVCNNIIEEKSNKKLSTKLFPLLTLNHLLNNKFNINILSKALKWSVSGQSFETAFKLALKYTPDKYRLPLLKLAIEYDSIDSVKLLINLGVDINGSLNNSGDTPLIIALSLSHMDIVNLLLKNNVDVHKAANDGYSPIHAVVNIGNSDILEKLINKKSNVNAKTIRGTTPLTIAARNGNLAIFNLLIAAGADVNISTPLVDAVQSGNLKIIEILITRGVDINKAIAPLFITPLFMAVTKGYKEIVSLLLKSGAVINKAEIKILNHPHEEILQLLQIYTGELWGNTI